MRTQFDAPRLGGRILVRSSVFIAVGLLAFIAAIISVQAYGDSRIYPNSLGCQFEGYAYADQTLGHAHTYNAGCASDLRVRMQYKATDGNWYLYGDQAVPTYGSPTQYSFYRWADTPMVFGTHQIVVGGLWRQEEYTMTW